MICLRFFLFFPSQYNIDILLSMLFLGDLLYGLLLEKSLQVFFFLLISSKLDIYHTYYFLKQPLAIRAKGMSLSVASNWLWNFGIGYATPYLVNASSTGVVGMTAANLGVKVFFIWGGTCVGCFIFTLSFFSFLFFFENSV